MNFYEELEYHTSDDDDYYRNVWDKGHMAPAATFDKTEEMLRTTFSYLNSALQHQRLNRYHWRYLEAYERELSEEIQDTVYVTVEVKFDTVVELLPTGASVPSGFYKFLSYGEEEECYYFPNIAPTKDWKEYKINCEL
jgi:endonuclease G